MFADVIISSPLVSAGFLLVHAIDRTSENINFAPGSSLAAIPAGESPANRGVQSLL